MMINVPFRMHKTSTQMWIKMLKEKVHFISFFLCCYRLLFPFLFSHNIPSQLINILSASWTFVSWHLYTVWHFNQWCSFLKIFLTEKTLPQMLVIHVSNFQSSNTSLTCYIKKLTFARSIAFEHSILYKYFHTLKICLTPHTIAWIISSNMFK